MTSLQQFFHMGGYAFYVWMSYGSVAMLLGIQWFMSWRRWRHYVKTQRKYS